MLSVTTYLTTDVAAIPLLWVVPLALYLLTFVLVFARKPPVPHAWVARAMPLVALLLALTLLAEATEPVWLLLPLHLLGLFVVSMVCHGELARDRPEARHLTAFYLALSAGGALGGAFNALLAPLVFVGLFEYPLVLVVACLLRPAPSSVGTSSLACPSGVEGQARLLVPTDVLLPLGVAALTAGLVLTGWLLDLTPGPARVGLSFAAPAVLCYTFLERPLRFGLGLGALLLAGGLAPGVHGSAIYRTRNFFGVHRVTVDPTGAYHRIVHGNTVHGQQSLDPARRGEPLTYYHRTGPAGRLFRALEGDVRLGRVALVGLGAGSLAAYGQPGQKWTYYEIDPAVVSIARNPAFFTFLQDSKATLDVVLGDARLRLREAEGERYGLIVVDAFSSDAVPVHLLTREALGVYLSRLDDDGLLLFNVSNRYLDLQRVVGDLAADAKLVCLYRDDLDVGEEEQRLGKSPSQWVVVARRLAPEDERKLRHTLWVPLPGRRNARPWTDDFSDLVSVFKW